MPAGVLSFGAETLDRIAAKMGLPLVVKPNSGGSGSCAVHREDDSLDGLLPIATRRSSNRSWAATSRGRRRPNDGPTALPRWRSLRFGDYDYDPCNQATRQTMPTGLDEDVAARVADIAVAVHETLGLRDMSRIDLIVDDAGGIKVIERIWLRGTPDLTAAHGRRGSRMTSVRRSRRWCGWRWPAAERSARTAAHVSRETWAASAAHRSPTARPDQPLTACASLRPLPPRLSHR